MAERLDDWHERFLAEVAANVDRQAETFAAMLKAAYPADWSFPKGIEWMRSEKNTMRGKGQTATDIREKLEGGPVAIVHTPFPAKFIEYGHMTKNGRRFIPPVPIIARTLAANSDALKRIVNGK
ncbi:MAG: hypothetical protein PHI18_10515 [bacterium]|nr:hypothetical protein [bacterium]